MCWVGRRLKNLSTDETCGEWRGEGLKMGRKSLCDGYRKSKTYQGKSEDNRWGVNQGEIQSLCWFGEAFKEVTTKAMAGGKGGG